MKLFILSLLAMAGTQTALAHDLDSVLRRLESAEAQAASAQQQLSSAQQQLTSAQQQISYAKQELWQFINQPSGPGTVCVYNYFSKQYTGRGADEKEATENAIFQCARDPGNTSPGDCRYWSNKNGNVQCRRTN